MNREIVLHKLAVQNFGCIDFSLKLVESVNYLLKINLINISINLYTAITLSNSGQFASKK